MNTKLVTTIAHIISVHLIAIADKREIPLASIISNEHLIELAQFYIDDKISNQGLVKALEIYADGETIPASELITKHNLVQVSDDSTLKAFVELAINNNPGPAQEYREGKVQVVGFLIGQCMKESKGQGNPKKFKELIETILV
jgi:aspartyl-tRNA(Asn)/glutamyl-tRNA(Gln) amidotransferase subunit B